MSRWFRLYDRLLDDPKAQRLPPDVFKGWINLLCLASRNNGELPALADIAFALRITDREADSLVQALMAAGLLEDAGERVAPHNWHELQYRSDADPTAADRKRRQRARSHADVTRDVTEMSRVQNRTETDTETEQKGAARDPLKSFPKFGSVGYGEWGALIRQHAPGRDVDMVADEFRRWCRQKQPTPIPFDAPGIDKTLATFCRHSTQRKSA
jgi:hypothetical protein